MDAHNTLYTTVMNMMYIRVNIYHNFNYMTHFTTHDLPIKLSFYDYNKQYTS